MNLEYIVAYNRDELNIRRKLEDEEYCNYSMINMYKSALYRYPNRKFGDIIPYNNQFWCCINAENAKDAFEKFCSLFEQYSRKDKIKENQQYGKEA